MVRQGSSEIFLGHIGDISAGVLPGWPSSTTLPESGLTRPQTMLKIVLAAAGPDQTGQTRRAPTWEETPPRVGQRFSINNEGFNYIFQHYFDSHCSLLLCSYLLR